MTTETDLETESPGVDIDAVHTGHVGQQGSDHCIAVLQVLHRYPAGTSTPDIARLTGIDMDTLRTVLRNLRARGRAQHDTEDEDLLWFTTQHLKSRKASLR